VHHKTRLLALGRGQEREASLCSTKKVIHKGNSGKGGIIVQHKKLASRKGHHFTVKIDCWHWGRGQGREACTKKGCWHWGREVFDIVTAMAFVTEKNCSQSTGGGKRLLASGKGRSLACCCCGAANEGSCFLLVLLVLTDDCQHWGGDIVMLSPSLHSKKGSCCCWMDVVGGGCFSMHYHCCQCQLLSTLLSLAATLAILQKIQHLITVLTCT